MTIEQVVFEERSAKEQDAKLIGDIDSMEGIVNQVGSKKDRLIQLRWNKFSENLAVLNRELSGIFGMITIEGDCTIDSPNVR